MFASTRQIYGRPEYLPVDEKHLLRPVDVNGINKMAGEWYHILYNNVYGIRACALRLTNTYGPRMRVKDARQTFLGIWIRLLLEGQPFEVFGTAQQLRDFTYVDDAVEALLLAARDADEPTARSTTSAVASGRQPQGPGRRCWSRMHGRRRLRAGPVPRRPQAHRHRRLLRRRPPASRPSWAGSRVSGCDEGLARTLEYYREHLPAYLLKTAAGSIPQCRPGSEYRAHRAEIDDAVARVPA